MNKPKAIRWTFEQGGMWFKIPLWDMKATHGLLKAMGNPYAIWFDDGTVWDPISGWREAQECPWVVIREDPSEWKGA